MGHRRRLLCAINWVILTTACQLRANNFTWTGNTSDDWLDKTNWKDGTSTATHAPTSSDAVSVSFVFGNSGPNISSSTTNVAQSVTLTGGGTLTHQGGTLTVANDALIGSTGLATYYFFGNSSTAALSVGGNLTVSSRGTMQQSGGVVVINGGQGLNVGTDSSHAGGNYSLNSSGTLTISNGLQIGSSGSATAAEFDWVSGSLSVGSITLSNAGSLVFSGSHTVSVPITVVGGEFEMIGSANLTASGPVVFNPGSFSAEVKKTNSGSVTLTGSLTYGALVTVHVIAGLLDFNLASAPTVAAGGGSLTIDSGGRVITHGSMDPFSNGSHTNRINIINNGTLTITSGTDQVRNLSGSGALVLSGGSLVVNEVAMLTYSGTISGSGSLTQAGNSILILSGPNSYSGGTNVVLGELWLGSDSALGTDGVNVAAGAILDTRGFSPTVTSLSGAGSAILGAGILTAGGGAATSTFSGILSGSGGQLVKIGTGTLTLSGTNTYSGGSTVTAGVLMLVNDNALGTDGVSVSSGAILNVNGRAPTVTSLSGAGSVTLGTGTLTAGNSNATSTFTGILSGTGGALVKIGTGTLTLTTNNTFTDGTSINGGTLAIAGDGSLGGIPGSPAVNLTFDGGSGGVLLPTADFSLAANRSILLSSNATFNTNSHTLTIPGIIGGSGTFTKTGAGTLILTGNNSWSGATTISTGTLQIGSGGTTGTLGTGNITNNATLAFNRTDAITVNNTISGSGTLTQLGTGTTTLTATYGATGPINVNAGKLVFASTAATRQTSAILAETSALSVTTTLDLTNRDMMIHSGSTAAFEAKVGSAYDFGAWDTPGITSSSAIGSGGLLTLGILSGTDYNTISPNTGTFDGKSVASGDTLLKFTYAGDINFDGLVDDNDLFLFLPTYLGSQVGNYAQGDLTYDGVVDDNDSFLFLPNYLNPPTQPLGGLTTAAVPEPASLYLLGLGTLLLSQRKRRGLPGK